MTSPKKQGVVHTEFYLTQARTEADLEGSFRMLPSDKHVLRFGRPDVEKIFGTMEAVAKKKNLDKVAVLTCGPPGLVASVKKQAELFSTKEGGVRFDMHVETFAF